MLKTWQARQRPPLQVSQAIRALMWQGYRTERAEDDELPDALTFLHSNS